MDYKVTWFFEGVQQASYGASAAVGWTETWYLSGGGSIDSVFDHPDVNNYTLLRLACLSSRYRMSFIRVALDGIPGTFAVGTVKVKTLPNLIGQAPTSGGDAQVQCAVLVDFQKLPIAAERVHHRKFLLRGLPANVINGNILNTGGIGWPSIKVFLNFIGQHEVGFPTGKPLATALGIRFQNPAVLPVPLETLSSISYDRTLVSGAFNDAVPVGTKYRITKVGGFYRIVLNRTWTVLSAVAGPPAATLLGRLAAKSAFPDSQPTPGQAYTVYQAPGLGTRQKVSPVYGPLSQYAVIGLRSKRTGRLFRQLRGRSTRRI